MKQTPIFLLGAGAVCCLVLGIIWPQAISALSLLSQPFQAIGEGLRQLSLSGNVGNWIAILLYLLLSLLPLLWAAFLHLKGKACWADFLLCLLCVLLFIAYYCFINPSLLPLPQLPGMGAMLLGGGIYSLLLSWLLIRCVLHFRAVGEKSMLQSLRHLMQVLAGVLVLAIFFLGFSDFLGKIRTLQEGNTGAEHLGWSYLFLFLQYAVESLPQALEIFVLLAAIALFRAMEKDRYAPASLLAAQKVSRLCALSLMITLLSHAALALFQLIFANQLHQIDMTLHFPLTDLIILLLSLLLSHLLVDGKKLKEDNALFI